MKPLSLILFLSLLVPLTLSLTIPLASRADVDTLSTSSPSVSTNLYLSKRSATSLSTLLSLIAALFPVNIAIAALSDVLTKAEVALAVVTGIDTTESALTASSTACADLIVIFARGTTEAGNVGALVGPPFFDAVRDKMKSSATMLVQGVEYLADVPGFLAGGNKGGSQTMANLVSRAITQCPKAKVVMSGYSQGGQVVHNAAKLLPAATMAAVSAVVIFGDPNKGIAVTGTTAAKTFVVCHFGDNICDGGDLVFLPHLTYCQDAPTAAAFVIGTIGN